METEERVSKDRWDNVQAYGLALICLLIGVALGYLIHGPAKPLAPVPGAATIEEATGGAPQMPTPDQMKHMADKQAEPLLLKLEKTPNDPALLSEIAKIYFTAHQFSDAISYAEKSVKANPNQVGIRADLASYLFYSGESDKAIAVLQDALNLEPNNAQVLFNLGLLKLQAKDDKAGAIALWKQLLKSHPELSEDRRRAVQQAIASAEKSPRPLR